ncbi:helix-turn-helix transcriptional regulator [Vagococcus sp. BWB3-3]|uniref:Helix-turn-helix transcriptional regulator n=1 Tax=Vagococcus allomyrinae TaxID=2794353 RepID=A0A940SWN2_9ENTE|nr:AraC family transcriptional regulator [Vagococcus allomyrinae]MBP1042326.1 helix-turn-helix transcriptional regulator [Vagococcus allomyrinae]
MRVIKEIIDYMNQTANQGIKVEAIAAKFGYSKFHFSREFKKITGISPNEYLAGIKIDKGILSMLHGESVINSQLEAGHASSGTFANTFSRHTGLSPREYAKQVNELYETVKHQETVDEDQDSLFFRNPNYPTVVAPYKLTVHVKVPDDFQGLIFSGMFLKPNPNHQPVMGRCRVKEFTYLFYHLPKGQYYPLACGIRKSQNPLHYFDLQKAMRACDGQFVTFPLEKNEEITIELREKKISDPPLIINLPNILSNGIKQQLARNKKAIKRKMSLKNRKVE